MDSRNSATDGSPAKTETTATSLGSRVACRKCGRFVEVSDTFCPHCGARKDKGKAWYYHPVWILILALVALGPFALFLVWKSSRMRPAAKVLMAVFILAYTGLCAYFTYEMTTLELTHLRDFGDVMREFKSR